MSVKNETYLEKQSLIQQNILKLKILGAVILLLVFGWILSSAFIVHHNNLPDDYWSSVSVLKPILLDAPGFLAVLAIMTMISIAFVVWAYLKLHSLPEKYSEHTGQIRLVYWLCILGLFFNWLWVAAVVIVVTDWAKIADALSGRRSLTKNGSIDPDLEEGK